MFWTYSNAFSVLETVCTVLQRREGEAVNQRPQACAVQGETIDAIFNLLLPLLLVHYHSMCPKSMVNIDEFYSPSLYW
jgi:hypothetical protein